MHKGNMHVCEAKLDFFYRPAEGDIRPTGNKEAEQSADKAPEPSGEISV